MAFEKKSTCALCGKAIVIHAANALYCPDCRIIIRKKHKAEYRQSEAGKAVIDAYQAEYRQAHREQIRESSNQYRRNHLEKNREAARRWRAAHSEYCKAWRKAYAEAHPDIIKAQNIRRSERRRLQYAAKVGKPGAKLAWAKATGKLTYCERMRVTMYPLPCGTRGECKGCKHCPEGAACGNDGHYRWDMKV